MLKRKLMLIAIASLALMLGNNAFGQITKQKIKTGKTFVGKPPEKEPSAVEFPNLIRAKTKTTKAAGNLYDWHDDFRRRQPRKTNGYIGETEKNLSLKRKSSKSKVKKSEELEVEKDETHRQTPKSSKTEVSIETLERKKQPGRKRKNQTLMKETNAVKQWRGK